MFVQKAKTVAGNSLRADVIIRGGYNQKYRRCKRHADMRYEKLSNGVRCVNVLPCAATRCAALIAFLKAWACSLYTCQKYFRNFCMCCGYGICLHISSSL